ncbi:MAG: hypothetical protein OXE59_07610 [Bacteroidetes bacterium]|nr:hypothetical protein [Bacteroidota bacterium]
MSGYKKKELFGWFINAGGAGEKTPLLSMIMTSYPTPREKPSPMEYTIESLTVDPSMLEIPKIPQNSRWIALPSGSPPREKRIIQIPIGWSP